MTKTISTLLTGLALSLSFAAAGCDTSEPSRCQQGKCTVSRPPGGPPYPNPVPERCLEACRTLLGECDATAAIDSGLEDCSRQCRADFSAAEVDCLAELTCGEASDACLD